MLVLRIVFAALHKSFITSPPIINPAVAGTHAFEAGVERFLCAMVSVFAASFSVFSLSSEYKDDRLYTGPFGQAPLYK